MTIEMIQECEDSFEADLVEDMLASARCKIVAKIWKSKYNDYVQYDYEPFMTDGFNILIHYTAEDISRAMFADYMIKKRKKVIDRLEKLYSLEYDKTTYKLFGAWLR